MSAKEIKIERIAYGGDGVGYLDKKVCFIPETLPGEIVEIKITDQKKNFSRGKVIRILEKSPLREEPQCPHISECGGCQYQHLPYSEEIKWKEIQLKDHLKKALDIPEELFKPMVPSQDHYHYRNHISLKFKNKGGNAISGFIGKDNRSLIDIENCFLAHPSLSNVFKNDYSFQRKNITYSLDHKKKVCASIGEKLFKINIASTDIWTHPRSFFQSNLEVIEKIIYEIASKINELKPEYFFDLYSGVGLFSLTAAKEAPEIVCIENSPHSMGALEKNLHSLEANCHLIEGKVEDEFIPWFHKYKIRGKSVLFLDPPRIGLEKEFASLLADGKYGEDMIYLSCHLGALARDLEILLSKGEYKITKIIPFDMFPRTKHIETLVFLEKN